jgi:hypothetical protein
MCYDVELFEKNIILEDLICPINKGILKNPHFIKGTDCGHVFCFDCILFWVSNKKNCPVCYTEAKNTTEQPLQKNFTINNILEKLRMKCHNKQCNWEGNMVFFNEHINECAFEKIKCIMSECQEILERQNQNIHIKTCQFRIIKCNLCDMNISYNLIENHQKQKCRMVSIKCNKCQNIILRKDIFSHYDSCQEIFISCKYKNVGCEFNCGVIEMDKHLNENTKYHLELFEKKLNNIFTGNIKISILIKELVNINFQNNIFSVYISKAKDGNYYIYWKFLTGENSIKISIDYDLFNFKLNDYTWNYNFTHQVTLGTSYCGEFPLLIKNMEELNSSDYVFEDEIYMKINYFEIN